MVFILKNYNRFVIGSLDNPKIDNFYFHRFPSDVPKLLKFESGKKAREFLDKHAELEAEFEFDIVEFQPEDWLSYSSPWEPRRIVR